MGYRRVMECSVCGKDRCTENKCFRHGVIKNKSQRCSYRPAQRVRNWRDYGRGIIRTSGLFRRFRPHSFYLAVNEGIWKVYAGSNSALLSLLVDSMGNGFPCYMFSEYHTEMMEWFFGAVRSRAMRGFKGA